MSAATAPPPPAAAPRQGGKPNPAAAPPTAAASSATPATTANRSVPSRLALLRVTAMVSVLAWAVLTSTQLGLSWLSLGTAQADTAQLVRLQEAKVDLLHADALATNAFLVGGLEPAEQRTAYDEAITAATANLSAALSAQPADADVLAELNTIVVDYAAGMELARANNRQGLPVGAAYLNQSSSELRGRGMDLIDAAIDANAARSEDSLGAQHPFWILLPGLVVIGALWGIHRWVRNQFKRKYNSGLLWAIWLVALVTAGAFITTNSQAAVNANVRELEFQDVSDGAQIRGAANLARSNESLRLIARGSGASYEEAWVESAARVDDLIAYNSLGAGGPREDWAAYTDLHGQLVALDDGGDWDGAVQIATDPGPGSASASFTAFDDAIKSRIGSAAAAVETRLDPRNRISLLGWGGAALLLGLFGANRAWRGISRRLEEYA